MDTSTLAFLRLSNPWLDRPELGGEFIARHLPPRILPRLRVGEDWPVPGKAHLLIGARQVGKSTFLWDLFRRLRRAPLLLNAEEPSVRAACRSAVALAADLGALLAPEVPVLLEEAQHLEEAGLLIKGLTDLALPNPIFVTGSSSYHLRARTRESLAGRAVRAQLHPFSFAELAGDLSAEPPLLRASHLRERCLRQAVVGGYPEAWLSEHPADVLLRLREAFILRDASDLQRVRNLDAFRRLLRLAATQVGSLVNLAEWAAITGVSRPTVAAHLDILEECHLVRRVPPFAGGKRAELTHDPKVYFCDNGLLCSVLGRTERFEERTDRGPLLENLVGAELLKHLDPLGPLDALRFWRSKAGAEVDFVLERPDGLVGVEVKASEAPRRALSRSSRSFLEAYRPARFYVVGLGAEGQERVGGCEIRWVGPERVGEICVGSG